MLKKEKLLGVFIILFFLIGLGILGYTYLQHIKADEKMDEILYKANDLSTLSDELPYIGITSDMDIKEVKQLKNCIVIPSCKIKAPIVEGVMSDDLRLGAGHFPGTANVGENGNACYAGHYSTIYNCIFNGIEKLKTWTPMSLYNKNGKQYKYWVTKIYVTEPDDLSVLKQNKKEKRVTLVTCAKNGTKRLIIVGICASEDEITRLKKKRKVDNLVNLTKMAKERGSLTISKYLIDKKGRN